MVEQNSSYLGRHHREPEPNLVDSQTKIQETPQPSKHAHLYAVFFCGRIKNTIKTRVHRKMVKRITHYLGLHHHDPNPNFVDSQTSNPLYEHTIQKENSERHYRRHWGAEDISVQYARRLSRQFT